MGREIRRVPPNWEHPRDEAGRYIPLYDDDFRSAAQRWLDECTTWEMGTHRYLLERPELKKKYPFFWMYGGDPPDSNSYRMKFEVEANWYQVYETVSEGTPVTPPFATEDELVAYLVAHGDFWDQERGDGGWPEKNARAFVSAKWAPSLMVFQSAEGTVVAAPRDNNLETSPHLRKKTDQEESE